MTTDEKLTISQEKTPIKSRYWQLIFYPENMVENWQQLLPDVVQVPCSWILHDKDVLGEQFDKEHALDHRKTHGHCIVAYDGPTTQKAVLSNFNRLAIHNGVGCVVCAPIAEPIISVKAAYKYLIHDTESAKNAGKYQYDASERHDCNNFDIGLYVTISAAEKAHTLRIIINHIMGSHTTNFYDLMMWVFSLEDPDGKYFDTISSYSGFLERVCRGVYLHDNPDKT